MIVSLGICVVLPVLVVWISARVKMNKENKRTEVLIKALESNVGVDTDKLAEALAPSRKTEREVLFGRLLRGCLYTFLGVALLIVHTAMRPAADADGDFLNTLLVGGSASLAVGFSFLVVYFATRRSVLGRSES